MNDKYILDKQGNPTPEPDLMKWAKWFGDSDRTVKWECFGDVNVSTVFLGIDHSFSGKEPILWETMIFGGKYDEYQDRCGGNREQAEMMHKKAVEIVKGKEEINHETQQ